jgi:spermidine synthase
LPGKAVFAHKDLMSIRIIVLLLYFFSGFSALAYEITWARMLGLIIGTTVAAWGTLLAVYMGGMAFGAAAGGPLADRLGRPLRFFALCEACIGIFGAASPKLLHLSERLVSVLQPFSGSAPGAQGVIRAVAAASLLAIPTVLMGCTLPMISRALFSKESEPGSDLGTLYAANTFGAVAGSLVAGFILLPALGLSATLLVAAGINLAIAVITVLMAPPAAATDRADTAPGETGKPILPSASPPLLLPFVLVASGFCAMAYEVLWSRGLVFFLSSTTYAFTMVLSTVLTGLAFGGILAARVAKKTVDPVRWIASLQLCAGLLAVASPWLLQHAEIAIHFAEGTMAPSWLPWLAIRFALCAAVIFPMAVCAGATFPFAIGASIRSLRSSGRTVGSLASLNTVGGIAGALAAAFLIIPAAGIQRSFIIIGIVNCAAGVAAARTAVRFPRSVASGGIAAIGTIIAFSFVFVGNNPMIVHSRVIRRAEDPVSVVSYREDATASVAVLATDRSRTLNIDGFNAAGTFRYEYMHLLAHLPALLSPSPDTALVICLGTGTTCGTLSLYPEVHSIECAEISRAVIASSRCFADVNHDPADNPKIHISCDDGRNHLLRSAKRYNVITLEPMHPCLASATNLYSRDFYRLCRERLAPHGVMAQWAPMHALSQREYRMLIASFASVFPHTSLWFLGTEGILIGTMDSLRIDVAELRRRMAHGPVSADLERISLATPDRLLSCFLMDEGKIREYVRGVPLVSDDRPRIEFSAPRNLAQPSSRQWRANMEDLLANRMPVSGLVYNAGDSDASSITRCESASALIMKAGIANAHFQFLQARAEADSALLLMPEDTTARIISRDAAGNAALLCLDRARALRSKELPAQAEQAYLQALAIDSLCTPAHTELATLYAARGMMEKGLLQAQRAAASSPNDPEVRTNLAVFYLNCNRTAEAEAELLHAISVKGTYGRAYYFLGELYRETGRTELATAAAERARQFGYGAPPR